MYPLDKYTLSPSERDLASLTQCHDNLQQDYAVVSQQTKILRQAMCCCLLNLIWREVMMQGGPNNPIIVEDDLGVGQAAAMPWKEVPVQEVEVVQEVVLRRDVVAFLVLIGDQEEGSLEPSVMVP